MKVGFAAADPGYVVFFYAVLVRYTQSVFCSNDIQPLNLMRVLVTLLQSFESERQ